MPLSEQEQRLLDEMERSLYQNDAEFVAAVSGSGRGRMNYTALVSGILVAVLGVGLLIAGIMLRQPIIGVAGFIVMFVGVLLAVGGPRRRRVAASGRPSGKGPSGRPARRPAGFMDRMNDRWERRQGDDRR
jgi:hypothetical protein